MKVIASFDPPPERSLIYATLGTVFNVESGDLLGRIIDGIGRSPFDALVTTGPVVDAREFDRLPAHVKVAPYVDQQLVLGRCAAVVCHGGSGTVMAALSAGVPVVVLPLGADQPDNADRCVELGCTGRCRRGPPFRPTAQRTGDPVLRLEWLRVRA